MNQKSIVCIALLFSLLCGAYSQDINISVQDLMTYSKWRQSNKRAFLNEEEQIFRQVVFFENLKVINQHNSNPNRSYTVGINQFSDMTEEEFNSKILNQYINEERGYQLSSNEGIRRTTNVEQAPSIDWRVKGAVSTVKNQGSCGSCWTHSAVALMESFNYIKNGTNSNFSEQQLLDCVIESNGFKSRGCDGGSTPQALSYAQKFGMVDEKQYPYVAIQGECKITSITNGFKPKTVVRLKKNIDEIKNALNQGPVAVAVNASNWSSYKSGVFNNCSDKTNHGVLAIGYDVEGNWIIKNSWGQKWGENGFIRIAAGNTCGIISESLIITD